MEQNKTAKRVMHMTLQYSTLQNSRSRAYLTCSVLILVLRPFPKDNASSGTSSRSLRRAVWSRNEPSSKGSPVAPSPAARSGIRRIISLNLFRYSAETPSLVCWLREATSLGFHPYGTAMLDRLPVPFTLRFVGTSDTSNCMGKIKIILTSSNNY